jgi:HK97 family phage major capsid protein
MSRKLMKQSSPYVQDILMNDVLRAIADQVDKKFFAGTGASGMPKGIDQAITDASTAAVSSATTITWPLVQQFITTLQTLNVYGGDLSNIKWVLPPAMAAIVKGKTRDAGSGFYFMDQGGTMAGHDSFISPNATTGRIYLANWTDVMLAGEWGNLEIGITDDPANFNSGAKIIRCFYDVNFGARRPSAIAYASTFTA